MELSKTQRALNWIAAQPGRSAYSAAMHIGISPSVISRALANQKRPRCPTCGHVIAKDVQIP